MTLYNDICKEISNTKSQYKSCTSDANKTFTFIWGIASILLEGYFIFVVKKFNSLVKLILSSTVIHYLTFYIVFKKLLDDLHCLHCC